MELAANVQDYISQLSGISILLTTILVLVVSILWFYKKPKGMPPGPSRIPFLGSFVFLGADETKILPVMKNLGDQYGDIVTIYSGNRPLLILNSYEIIKEAFLTKGKENGGRGRDMRVKVYNPNYPLETGILDGHLSDEWKLQRNNALNILRSLGWGKDIVQASIQQEARTLLNILKDTNGKSCDFPALIPVTISNVICSLLFGKRYNHDDEEFMGLLHNLDEVFASFTTDSDAEDIPILKVIKPSYKANKAKAKTAGNNLMNYYLEMIEEGKKSMASGKEPDSFVTHYLAEMEKVSAGKSRINKDWLLYLISDFFLAGSETTATTLKWAIMFMAKYPHIQEKIHQELERKLGKEEHAFSISEREQFPYIEATLMEVQRISSTVAMGVPHQTLAPVTLGGYTIPKGIEMWSNIYAVHHDPRIWDSPEELRPERFLDKDGQLNKQDHWIPFSMGRRTCLGEQLARQEMFLIFSHILHNFTISFPPDQPVPSDEGVFVIVHKPLPYKVCFNNRL